MLEGHVIIVVGPAEALYTEDQTTSGADVMPIPAKRWIEEG